MLSGTEAASAHARLAYELLHCLSVPPHDKHPVERAAMVLNVEFAFAAEPLLRALLEGNENLWARLLSHFVQDRYRFISLFPRHGTSIEWAQCRTIDLYTGFKACSPFADVPLHFVVKGTRLEAAAAGALKINRLSAETDDFAFVIRNGQIFPVWIRARPDGDGLPPRSGPLRDSSP